MWMVVRLILISKAKILSISVATSTDFVYKKIPLIMQGV